MKQAAARQTWGTMMAAKERIQKRTVSRFFVKVRGRNKGFATLMEACKAAAKEDIRAEVLGIKREALLGLNEERAKEEVRRLYGVAYPPPNDWSYSFMDFYEYRQDVQRRADKMYREWVNGG